MTETERDLVRQRAGHRCEYCHLPQAIHDERFSIDHIISLKHRGADAIDNLALCCLRCNLFKGTDLASIDPATGLVVELFHPRRQTWAEHFRFHGELIMGLTPSGRATAALLQMNAPDRLRLRASLLAEGNLGLD